MPAGSSRTVRATALALAIGANALFLLLLLGSRGAAPPRQPALTAMIWIAPLEPPRPPPPPRRESTRHALTRSQLSVVNPVPVAPSVPVQVPELSSVPRTSIDAPQIDWHEQASKAANELVRNEQEQAKRRRLLDSEPKVLDLPERHTFEKGRAEHFEGGVVMWHDGTCTYTSDPQVMQPWSLDPVGKFFGVHPGKACRNLSRERADALEEATKPTYLGGKRPLRQEEASGIKIP